MEAWDVLIEDLRHTWPGSRHCLRVPELRLAQGERLFLHGPSGSGKSTLLGLIAGVLPVEAGQLWALGEPLHALKPAARDRWRGERLGILFQTFNLLPALPVLDNVLLACRFAPARMARLATPGQSPTVAAEAEARRLLRRLGIGDELHRRAVTALSLGQQQRVAAARALLGRPALVLADEPTSALDEDNRQGFLDLLLAECAANGASLLFVSHDRRPMDRFDRSLSLTDILQEETP